MKLLKLIILILLIPVVINYGLLSWKAPGLNGDTGDWLGFLANFLGLIGAVLIALYQFKKQREIDQEKNIEQNRSYVDIQDFNATLMLKGVTTHENSRVIRTEGYDLLLKEAEIDQYGGIKVGYLKIAHFGIPELIFNCSISIDASICRSGVYDEETLNVNVGVIEKGVEIFIPLQPLRGDQGKEIILEKVIFNYSTLIGERLQIFRDYINRKEVLYSINNDLKTVLFEYDMKQVGWTYPNKIDHSKLAP
ncbi:hypothetical protein [Paenibacillus sp. 7523-1]|uniref:hypothetical protein n=1 Tax=Paenibacillus sp. 7523-1 TaxID=2022550 RepID=UPI000BA6A231|nr:hypothetical protein [Paenibacillus sp. 7523-1]PAD31444.1 hypothetical protein CHH60_08885 [Paenibacillus sp. 7523-1]